MGKGESKKNFLIGLVDADLLDGGTRHPNLALLKIAGYLRDHNIPYELIADHNADLKKYQFIYISRVFSFTKLPDFYTNASPSVKKRKFRIGGTGFYMGSNESSSFIQERADDLQRLEQDPNLPGFCMRSQMPDYHLYEGFVAKQIERGIKPNHYKDYLHYSIGFLTRGCFRKCPFCVNRFETKSQAYSQLKDFVDPTRPYIYLWDDNFLASPYSVWKPALQKLIEMNKPFQFRQGLDERMIAQSPYGEEMAKMLSKSKYHGDFIFAFDNWEDRPIIEKALKIWKKYNPTKGTKFYLFCGFKQNSADTQLFYKDICEIFKRIKVLMQYKCVGYIMRHEDYHQAPIPNFYVQVARWCNQQAFYKKMSFWEFCYRNQTYWEEKTLGITGRPQLKSFEEFEKDLHQGYYNKNGLKVSRPLQTVLGVLELFPTHREELIEMFNYKMTNIVDTSLWQLNNNHPIK